MTSKLTRERLQEIAEDGFLKHGESKELARMALAAMDSEPVAYTDERNLGYIDRGRETAYLWGKQNSEASDVALYRHAQPAVDSDFIPKNLDKALGVVGVAIPESREEFNLQAERWIQRLIDRVIRYADEFQEQPALVVPDEIKHRIGGLDWGWEGEFNRGWNACRAAMLQAGNSPVIPDSARDALEKALAAMEFMGDTLNNLDAVCTEDVELVAPAFDAVRSVLAAAPQSPGSEPATVPGKWIPVSERMPDENAEQHVLACFKGGDISTLYYFEGRWDDAYGIVPIRQDVTHWMPLPAAPQEVK
ncbi:DUF551 domain-containing protein [Klebsiella pneumoniae]|uniref:DUF551 domain-containing protein n=1 Tax=Klebsiella pneumoniae TaxID=573 RepID=UPI003D6D79B7